MSPEWMTPAEAAAALRVQTPTLLRYARKGLLTSVTTPSGYRRYLASEIRDLAVNGVRKGEGDVS